MLINELVESWINGNHSTVIDTIIGKKTKADVAWWAATVAMNLPTDERSSFITFISHRMST